MRQQSGKPSKEVRTSDSAGVPGAFSISLVPNAPALVRSQILDGLRRYNRSQTNAPQWEDLTLILQDASGAIAGGLTGQFGWSWLHIGVLWVDEYHRGAGHGSRLLEHAEEEASVRGCIGVYLDTLEFQAPSFYRARGYEAFGVLEGFPPGSRQTYFQKRFEKGAGTC